MNSEPRHPSANRSQLNMLEKNVGPLFPVPAEAAEEYFSKIPELASMVDSAVFYRNDVNQIVGSCPVDVLAANHRNHARFMTVVFKLGLPRMLSAVVPWAYRVYMNHGVSERYFYEEMQAWIQALDSSLSAESARPLKDVYTCMLQQHQEMLRLADELVDTMPQYPDDAGDDLDSIVNCLLKCDSRKSREMLCADLAENDFASLYLKRIQPVMYKIGTLWAEGKIQVTHEHMVTALVSRVMASYYDKFTAADFGKGRAVLTCATDEFHELGARIVGDMLELDGWDVTFLGANVPQDDFVSTVIEIKPDIVGISVTVPYHLLRLQEMVAALRKKDELKYVKIVAGGLPFCIDETIKDKLDLDGWAADGAEAVDLARSWWEDGCRQ